MAQKYKYLAFISYSHKDMKFARWLHKKIENYKIPKSLREKYPNLPKTLARTIFRDEEELPTAGSLPFNLEKNLQLSQKLIVICSPNAAGVDKKEGEKNWIDEEIKYFKTYHENGNKKILPIMISGIPHASELAVYNSKEECFPKALRYKVDKNGNITNEKEEVLAADARVKWYEFIKKRKALIKVIAGVLGVDFADLWERDKREQRKKIAFRAFIAAGVVALGVYAYQIKYTTDKFQELEDIKTQIVNIEHKLRADDINETLAIKLNQTLEKLKKKKEQLEDTLKWLGKYNTPTLQKTKEILKKEGTYKAIAFLESDEKKALRIRKAKENSKEYIALAKMYAQINNLNKAKLYYQKAINSYFDYENAIVYAAFLQKQNKLKEAEEIYKKLLTIKLNSYEYAGALNDLALLQVKINQNQEALKNYKEALKIYKELAKKNPNAFNYYVAMTLNNLAGLQYKLNQNQEALKNYKEALKIRKELAKKNSNAFLPDVAITLNNLALFTK